MQTWVQNGDGSLVEAISNLPVGGEYARVRTIARAHADSGIVIRTKKSIGNTVSKAISRVREQHVLRKFKTRTHHHVTDDLDVVVVAVVTRVEDEL